tara:strand:- start:7917 stop:8363 length:447 start_codon:yes stop_codon:yes gene_type:complete
MCTPEIYQQMGGMQTGEETQNSTSSGVQNFIKDLGLTTQEMQIVDYHNETISQGRVGEDTQGRPVTVFAKGIKIPSGKPYAGQFVSVPGYNRDKKSIMTEGQAYKHWEAEISAGKWPLYASGAQLNKRSEEIHRIMDMEAERARRAGQ